jgi:uncharacterized membrane protein YoaK (UPF0700 family)
VPDNPSTLVSTRVHRLFRVALLLAFVGGYGDAGSYLLTKSFTGHVTGNTVLFAVNLAWGAWGDARTCALAVAAFLGGGALAELMELGTGSGSAAADDPRVLRWALAAEGLLLAGAIGCRLHSGSGLGVAGCVLLACAALGMQNGALRRCGSVSVHTTFMTGMATSMVTSTVRRSTGTARPEDEKKTPIGMLATVWAMFLLGAAAGAGLTFHYQAWGFAGILVPLAIAGALSWLG